MTTAQHQDSESAEPAHRPMLLLVSDNLLRSPAWQLPPGYRETRRDIHGQGTWQITVDGPFPSSVLPGTMLRFEVSRGRRGVTWQWLDYGEPLGEAIPIPAAA